MLSRPVPLPASWTLIGVGLLIYLAVAVMKWRLGSLHHMLLALGLMVIIGLSSRRMTMGTALVLLAALACGLVRAWTGFGLMGFR